jgi:2-C-methyl-D-erythritol 4-phosphate cytidylyltransferase
VTTPQDLAIAEFILSNREQVTGDW